MKTKIISLLVLIAIAVVSCQKDEADKPVKMQDVSFGIERMDPNLLKDDPVDPFLCPNNLDAVKAEIKIGVMVDNVIVDINTYVVDLYIINDKFYTQAFKLEAGEDYWVTSFVLLDEDNNFVMAIPEAVSDYAEYVSMTVPFNVIVGNFTKVEIPVEVLCFLPSEYDKFGFIWFAITEIVVREFCFFGDICANGEPHFPAVFVGSAYDDGDPLTPIPIDMHAIYEIRVFRNGVAFPAVDQNVFSNALNPLEPLCVQFPDLLRNLNEAGFVFELWVLVPPSPFAYVKFAEFDVVEVNGVWSILYGGVDALDDDFNAVDFAIGTCSPMSTHEFPYPVIP